METKSHVVLLLRVLQHALRTKHLVTVIAEELYFFVLMYLTKES